MMKIVIFGNTTEYSSLISLIHNQDNTDFKGIAYNPDEFIDMAKREIAEIIIIDINKENKDEVFGMTKEILQQIPKAKIIMVSDCSDDDMIADSYYAGAIDYIIKSQSFEPIMASISHIEKNPDYLGPSIIQQVNSELMKYKTMQKSLLFFVNNFTLLTQTEKNVLKGLYYGQTRQQYADDHYLSITTVHSHVKHILKKLGFSSTRALMAYLKDIQLFENFNI